MAPDLNSLPPSRSSTSSPLQPRSNWSTTAIDGQNSNETNNSQAPSSRSSSVAPAMNNPASTDLSHRPSLGGGHRSSPQSSRPSISESRRRSGIGMHLNLNDPAISAGADHTEHRSSSFSNNFRTASPTSLGGSPIIATGDPHHQRAPSLGELHQELEQEQEAQVNRLLQMIRQQQVQLHQLHQQQQQQQNQSSTSGIAVIDDSLTPNSERSQSFPSIPPLPTPGTSRSLQLHSSFSTRRGSRASETMSPNLTSTAAPPLAQPSPAAIDPAHSSFSSDWSILGGGGGGGGGGSETAVSSASARRSSRDESAFYQAEAAMLSRENQMLQMRIRELERQLSELTPPSSGVTATASNVAATSEGAIATGAHAGISNATGTASTFENPEGVEKT